MSSLRLRQERISSLHAPEGGDLQPGIDGVLAWAGGGGDGQGHDTFFRLVL